MAQFSDLVPEIRPLVQKAPIPVITNAVLMAARELCRDSFCYRHTVSRLTTVDAQADYTPTLPVDTRIVKIISWDFPSRLSVRAQEDLDLTMPDWRVMPGVPRFITLKDGNTVTLAPAPATGANNQLGLLLALQPVRSATSVEDEFMEQNAEYIINGALANLMLQKGQEWFDPQTGAFYKQLFENDKIEAKAAARQDNNAKARPMTYGGI